MSQRKPGSLSVADVVKRTAQQAAQAKQASAQDGALDDSALGAILDGVTGQTTKEAAAQAASDTPSIGDQLSTKVAETAALGQSMAIKEAQLLGAALVDGAMVRSAQYGNVTEKVAGD